MKFNQQILLKHEYGITAQWISDDFSWTAVPSLAAKFDQLKLKLKHAKDAADPARLHGDYQVCVGRGGGATYKAGPSYDY